MTKHFMKGCEIPKILVYKTLRSYIRNSDVGEVLTLGSFRSLAKLFAESVPGVYRSLKPFLLRLADMYLCIHEKKASALRSLIKRKEYCMWQ